ncbi:hypothetical protein PRUPE_3G257200 [Prunus persica]|uniref:FBD domain-containing protein n=1 Tax=Prunus persica TaxID=3760 RepID=A0A251Q5J2_PRUPE|nr:hypothetical protein PRUPE_3G257200 [Prunus persica]
MSKGKATDLQTTECTRQTEGRKIAINFGDHDEKEDNYLLDEKGDNYFIDYTRDNYLFKEEDDDDDDDDYFLDDEKGDNYSGEDRISELPDEILIAIVSLLDTWEGGRTCVISKRWRFLWASVTCLNFDRKEWEFTEPLRKPCICGLFKILQSHQGSTLERLRIGYCDLDSECCRSDVDNSIESAILQKRVQRLEIDDVRFSNDPYIFPERPFKTPFGVSCIKSLTHLSFNNTNIHSRIVCHFLSHCPLLEHLCIRRSSEIYVLKVVGPSLRLKFLQISDCPSVVKIEIFAPNLLSFIYDGRGPYRTGIVMKHAPSLVMLSLAEPCDCISKAFRSVSSCFSRLQTLSLRIGLGQRSIMLPESPQLSSLKKLSLAIHMGQNSKILMDLTSLIERSPFLHRLELRLKWSGLFRYCTSSVQKIKKCPHPCLKVVKISGFIGSRMDTMFAMYLIENSLVLEKLIFDLHKTYDFLSRKQYLSRKTIKKKIEATRKHALQIGKQLPPGAELIVI